MKFELLPNAMNSFAISQDFDESTDITNDSNDSNLVNSSFNSSTPSLVCGLVMMTVAAVGFFGNLMTALVFGLKKFSTPKSNANSINETSALINKRNSVVVLASKQGGPRLTSISVLVTGLSLADALLLSLSCPLFASSAFMTYSPTLSMMNAVSYMTVYVYPLASTFQTMSVWTLSVITIERYTAVVRPFLARRVCKASRAFLALVIIFLLSFAYNAPRFWEYHVVRLEAADDPNVVLVMAVPTLRMNEVYMRVYGHWMYFVFIFAVPFTILATFNGFVVRCVRMARRRRQTLTNQQTKEQGTAVMMVLVAFIFLACNLLAFLLNALEVFGVSGAQRMTLPGDMAPETVRHSSVFYILVDFNNLLVMTHCSINFFVYYNFSQRFRLGCFQLWSRFAIFRFMCGGYLNSIAAAASEVGSTYENDTRRASMRSKRGSVMSVRYQNKDIEEDGNTKMQGDEVAVKNTAV